MCQISPGFSIKKNSTQEHRHSEILDFQNESYVKYSQTCAIENITKVDLKSYNFTKINEKLFLTLKLNGRGLYI